MGRCPGRRRSTQSYILTDSSLEKKEPFIAPGCHQAVLNFCVHGVPLFGGFFLGGRGGCWKTARCGMEEMYKIAFTKMSVWCRLISPQDLRTSDAHTSAGSKTFNHDETLLEHHPCFWSLVDYFLLAGGKKPCMRCLTHLATVNQMENITSF